MGSTFINALLSTGSSRASQYILGSQAPSAHDQHTRLVLEHGQEAVMKDVDALLQQLSAQVSKVRLRVAVCTQHSHRYVPTMISQPCDLLHPRRFVMQCQAIVVTLKALTGTCMQALKVILQATRTPSFNTDTAPADAAACSSLRSALFAALPGWMHSLPEDEQQLAADLAAAFLPELDTSWQQQAADLAPLLYACLSGLEESKPHCLALLELLPPCLAAICAAPAPADDLMPDAAVGAGSDNGEAATAAGSAGGEGGSTAAFYKDQAANRLLNCGWEKRPEQVGQLLQLLKALPLTQEQLEKAVKKGIMACR
jgi:hypothetical protein